jgi:predicted amidophosphoribosyltransferase
MVLDRQISPDDRLTACNRCAKVVDEDELYCDECATLIAEQELDLKASWWDNFDFDLYEKLLKTK